MFGRLKSFHSDSSTADATFLKLPSDLLLHEVIPWLDDVTFCNLLQTCKALDELSTSNNAWETILNQNFGKNWPAVLSEKNHAELEVLQLGSLLQPRPGIYRKIYSWLSAPEAKFLPEMVSHRNFTHTIKVTVLGSAGVGKTTLLERGVLNKYQPDDRCNIGVAFFSIIYKPIVEKNFEDFPDKPLRSVCAQCWDTAGQERFRSIATYYYRGTNAVLLCFSIIDRVSFEELRTVWIPEVQTRSSPHCQLILVGLKCDRPDSERRVSRTEARTLASEIGVKYIECSSKEDINVRKVMAHAVTRAVESLRRRSPSAAAGPTQINGARNANDLAQRSYVVRALEWIKSFWS